MNRVKIETYRARCNQLKFELIMQIGADVSAFSDANQA